MRTTYAGLMTVCHRASHWETRVMRDDVMTYGREARVSSITLAAMEDLGDHVTIMRPRDHVCMCVCDHFTM